MKETKFWDPYSEFQKAVLPNGLTIYAAQWPGRAWQKTGFIIHSGARHDDIGLEGTAHFLEHMVSLNASVGRDDIYKFFSNTGGNVDLGGTRYHATDYDFLIPADKALFAESLEIFSSMLMNCKIVNSIESERKVIEREYFQKFSLKFASEATFRKHRALYSGHWLERFISPLGSPDSIEKINQDCLQKFYDQHYVPANMSIVTVGGFDIDTVVRLVSDSPFYIKKIGNQNPLPQPVISFSNVVENRQIYRTEEFLNNSQSGDFCGFGLVARFPGDSKQEAMGMLCRLLKNLLFEEIREQRSWAYSISCDTHNHVAFTEMEIYCGKMNPSVHSEIEAVVDECIRSVKDKKNLFERYKKSEIASLLLRDFSRDGVLNGAMSDVRLYRSVIPLNNSKKELEETSFEDVVDLLKYFSKENTYSTLLIP